MNSLEEFFKNRISFTMWDDIGDRRYIRCFSTKEAFLYDSLIYNPLSLHIINTFDLVEILTPLFYYIMSALEKFKNEDENYPDYTLRVFAKVYPYINGLYKLDEFFSK